MSACAQAPEPVVHHSGKTRSREHFAEGFYGKASARVVDDGSPIPRGGGQYLVGRPYHIAGRWYYPHEDTHYVGNGIASWYGDAFHGRKTANGEIYDKRALSAAHPTMPLPSYARVTNQSNGYSVIVRVNDRGPYAAGRVMDVSSRVADVLDFKRMGTAHVKVEYIGPAPMEGSDDDALLATLRTDGGPAEIGGVAVAASEVASPLLSMFGAKSKPPDPPPPPEATAPEPEPAVEAAEPAPEPAPPPPRARPPRRESHEMKPEVVDATDGDIEPPHAEKASAEEAPPRVARAKAREDEPAARHPAAPVPHARPAELRMSDAADESADAPLPPKRSGKAPGGERALY